MSISPEMDLIEILWALDEQLCTVRATFRGDTEHARRVLLIYLRFGIVVIRYRTDSEDHLLEYGEATQVLADQQNWEPRSEGQPAYYASLTDKAVRAYESGPEAWEQMFDKYQAINGS